MQTRTITLLLVLGLGILAWCLWPPGGDPSPQPRTDLTATTGTETGIANSVAEQTQAQQGLTSEATDDAPLLRTEVIDPNTFRVRGRTVRKSNTPLPNATVRARAYAGTKASGPPVHDALLTSDGEGRFVWSIPPVDRLLFLDLRGEGERIRTYAETFVIAPGDPPPEPFDLWIVPLTSTVRGIVLDPDDHPIAGARVGSSSRGTGVTTNANGRFEIAVAHKASVRLYASASGFVELRQDVAIDLDTGLGDAELRLRRAHRIHGRVTDPEGRPVAGAVVRTFHTIFTTGSESDGDGRFVVDNLDPSLKTHSLFARKLGYVEAKAQVELTGTEAEQDLVMTYGVEVRGTVTGPTGSPLSAATVFLGFSPSAYDRIDSITDIAGRFAFPCVAPGEHTLNVERRGFSGLRQKIQVPEPPSPPVIVPVRLDTGHFIGGRAIDAAGKPISGVSIAPRLDGEYLDGVRAKTDAKGRFRLEGLPAEGLDLEFYGNGILRHNEPVAAVDHDTLEITLERHGRLAGTVVDGRTGQPITDFHIRFGQPRPAAGEESVSGYSAMWIRGGKAFHDENGVFRISEGMKIGSIAALEISAEGFGATIDNHVVAKLEPDPAQLVIRLYPGVVIEGVVREHGTALPIAGVLVKAFSQNRPLRPSQPSDDVGRPIATTDGAGRFRLENVGAGQVSIATSHAEWLPVTHGPIEVTSGTFVPAQEIELNRGVSVTVELRDADGEAMADAFVHLPAMGQSRTKTNAKGTVTFDRVAPGSHPLRVTIPGAGTFDRTVHIKRGANHIEFTPTDGDATLVVFINAPAPLAANTQLRIAAKQVNHRDGAFRARTVFLTAGRNVVEQLPAGEFHLFVFGPDGASGRANATTLAGQIVETRIQITQTQRR